MSFTRFNYDECRSKKKLKEATGPGRYILDTPGWGNNPSFFNDPQMRIQGWGANLHTSSHPIDIEMSLSNRGTKLSKYNVNYKKVENVMNKAEKVNYPVNSRPITDESRVTHPASLYREKEHDRRYPLLLNPQENTEIKFNSNLNTRLLERDNFRPKLPCIN